MIFTNILIILDVPCDVYPDFLIYIWNAHNMNYGGIFHVCMYKD